ncbi:uncharacterized protein LAJ45_02052 [Morchella importuna]|uniref:uncharacterized protein n=1 Tax=Morchella importuna TaxID=1174673 RepID=UPI001E8D9413|nr:uncharacterized protein LAJ45_02052 [Morchella importuna]KAH8154284.1 hypothetical protein LAJ45_02052 [Morchella importuna]
MTSLARDTLDINLQVILTSSMGAGSSFPSRLHSSYSYGVSTTSRVPQCLTSTVARPKPDLSAASRIGHLKTRSPVPTTTYVAQPEL